jgi:GNAT superfamily N-acetyltransferase
MSAVSEATRSKWRDAMAASCRLWQGPLGRHIAEPGFAFTFSGERAIDYNVAICHAPGAEFIERALAEVVATRSPGLIMLAGPGLGVARHLSEEGWIPVSSSPFRGQPIALHVDQPAVRRLALADLARFRLLIEESFRMPASLSILAVPDSTAVDAPDADPAFASWGMYEGDVLVSAVVTVTIEKDVCIWMMATLPAEQGRGYGRRLLSGALGNCASQGADRALLLASPSGDPLYQSMGFDVIEYWQVWSRSRWVLG